MAVEPDISDGAAAVSRRGVLIGGGAMGAAGLMLALNPAPALADPASLSSTDGRSKSGDFVAVKHGSFWLHGKRFRFGGTNCYYLHQQSHYMIDAVLNDAAAMSLSVIRAWAFADGTGTAALQPSPGVYNSAAFDSLDYAIAKAGQLGIKLVLVLTNNWPDYGGMQQYVKWFLNLPDDSYGDSVNHDLFYSTPAIIKAYKAYAKYVTHRRNPYTGLRYNEDPTIMTFELANEPRSRSEKTGSRLLRWVTDVSEYVKAQAPRQLVAIGDEGFYGDPNNSDYPYSTYEGNRWKDLIRVSTVDYGTFHLYPQGWGENPQNKPGTDPVVWGTTWITDHIADGRAAGKPVVLEEYGLAINADTGVPDVARRDAGYAAWTNAVLDNGGAGDQFWLLTSRVDDGSFYPDYDGYRVYWYNDPGNPSNSTAHLLSAHAKAISSA
jgi:mannan endo-1,4-beta-mannosidase